MHDEQTVQSERSQKGSEDVVKLLIGVGHNAMVPLQREPCVA